MDYDRYNRRIPAGRPQEGAVEEAAGGGRGDYYGRGRRGTTQREQIAAVNPQYYMMTHPNPYLQYPTTAQQPIVMMTAAPTSTAAQQKLPFLTRAGGGGRGGGHPPTPPYATTPLTFQSTPITATPSAGVKSHYYGAAAPPILSSSPPPRLLPPQPGAGAGAVGAEVSPLLGAATKHKAVKLNTVTVSPTKSTDAHNSNNKKKQKRNKISKEDLKRAMNIPISSTAQAAAAVGKGNNNKTKTKEDRRVKKERRERENNHRERETTKKNAIEIKSKRGTRERSRRSKRKRNPEKRYNDYDEKRRINETDRDEYDSESDEDEGDDYEDEDEDEERESWHDSRSRSRRRYGHDLSDDSYIDRRRRDDSYRARPSRSSRSRRRNEQRYNDYEYDAVEVGIDDEPWYFQASDMIQDSCPALNCDGYAEPDSYVGDYHGYEHTTRPAGRQRFYETTRNKAKPNARRTDYCCGDEVVIPQWLLFAVGGMIGCCFIF